MSRKPPKTRPDGILFPYIGVLKEHGFERTIKATDDISKAERMLVSKSGLRERGQNTLSECIEFLEVHACYLATVHHEIFDPPGEEKNPSRTMPTIMTTIFMENAVKVANCFEMYESLRRRFAISNTIPAVVAHCVMDVMSKAWLVTRHIATKLRQTDHPEIRAIRDKINKFANFVKPAYRQGAWDQLAARFKKAAASVEAMRKAEEGARVSVTAEARRDAAILARCIADIRASEDEQKTHAALLASATEIITTFTDGDVKATITVPEDQKKIFDQLDTMHELLIVIIKEFLFMIPIVVTRKQ